MKCDRDEIINILMHRDGFTREEAVDIILECKRALEEGEYDAVQNILGLEDDYIFGVLGY